MKQLCIINDPTGPVVVNYETIPIERVSWTSKMAVDSDGCGDPHGDPDQQSDTSLHMNGRPLNADIDKYIVVPPAIIEGTRGIVLGCRGTATNRTNGKQVQIVVGDIGPHEKIGEASCATAAALGVDPSPTTGGTDNHIIDYVIYPGMAAPGYLLQAA